MSSAGIINFKFIYNETTVYLHTLIPVNQLKQIVEGGKALATIVVNKLKMYNSR